MDLLKEIAEKYGVTSNFNADQSQGGGGFGSLLTNEESRPSRKELGINNDPTKNLKPRREVIFKTMDVGGKMILYPNPKYLNIVRKIAAEAGVTIEIGKELSSSDCWESFGIGWADPKEL